MVDKAKIKPLLVPVDFSPHSEAALLKACELAACMKLPIVVLHVAHDPGDMQGYYKRTSKKNQLMRIEDIAREMLDDFVEWAPSPAARDTETRSVAADEENFSGFVFKIQANMDPKHRDRIAFLRVCSGNYDKGMKMRHVRLGRDIKVNDAVTFLAGEREQAEEAVSGDIIGLHNHGTIQLGDTFTAGEDLKFTGIPHFAPELFRRIRLKDPMKLKQLQKGLTQLSE